MFRSPSEPVLQIPWHPSPPESSFYEAAELPGSPFPSSFPLGSAEILFIYLFTALPLSPGRLSRRKRGAAAVTGGEGTVWGHREKLSLLSGPSGMLQKLIPVGSSGPRTRARCGCRLQAPKAASAPLSRVNGGNPAALGAFRGVTGGGCHLLSQLGPKPAWDSARDGEAAGRAEKIPGEAAEGTEEPRPRCHPRGEGTVGCHPQGGLQHPERVWAAEPAIINSNYQLQLALPTPREGHKHPRASGEGAPDREGTMLPTPPPIPPFFFLFK